MLAIALFGGCRRAGARRGTAGLKAPLFASGLIVNNALPDLPTVSEAALPGFDVSAWNGLMAPRAVIDRIGSELRRIIQIPEVSQRVDAQGAELLTNSPEEFTNYLKDQIAKWPGLVQSTGVRAD